MRKEIHKIVNFEIPAKDPERLRKFYTDVFGWKFKNSAAQNMQYWTISTGTNHNNWVGGGIYKKGSTKQTLVNYISTPDLDESIAEIERAGGHITVGRKETSGHGFTAIGKDPEGNPIGLFESSDRGLFRKRGKLSQSGANRIKSKRRNNKTADSE